MTLFYAGLAFIISLYCIMVLIALAKGYAYTLYAKLGTTILILSLVAPIFIAKIWLDYVHKGMKEGCYDGIKIKTIYFFAKGYFQLYSEVIESCAESLEKAKDARKIGNTVTGNWIKAYIKQLA